MLSRRTITVAALCTLALAACSSPTETQRPAESPTSTATSTPTEDLAGSELTVVTHDSFTLPDEVLAQFEDETGMSVNIVQPGDGGSLVNQLILTKDSPLGDAVFGIDNTFATRALNEGVLEPYQSAALPETSTQFAIDGLTPIDFGDVCLNADTQWFEDNDITIPTTFDDLTDPEYKDLLVVTNPASSSPGLAMLLATIGAKGENGWQDYWRALRDNGVTVAQDWTEAYNSEFTATGEGGEHPLVLSYATSPAFTVNEEGTESSTVALLGTCFRQIEYAGVIEGAQNPEGAKAFVDFLLSPEVQQAIPESMFMYPVDTETELPPVWQKFAPLASRPNEVSAEDIDANRDPWIEQWTNLVLQ